MTPTSSVRPPPRREPTTQQKNRTLEHERSLCRLPRPRTVAPCLVPGGLRRWSPVTPPHAKPEEKTTTCKQTKPSAVHVYQTPAAHPFSTTGTSSTLTLHLATSTTATRIPCNHNRTPPTSIHPQVNAPPLRAAPVSHDFPSEHPFLIFPLVSHTRRAMLLRRHVTLHATFRPHQTTPPTKAFLIPHMRDSTAFENT